MATFESLLPNGLLPTPRAGKTTDEEMEVWLVRKRAGKVSTPPLGLAIQLALLPTPTCGDAEASGGRRINGPDKHSGMTLTDAIVRRPLIYSPGDSPANPSAMPGKSEATKTTVSSGLRCFASSGKRVRLGSLARTLLGSSTWHSTKCALTWKEKATKSNRLLFQLRPSALPTAEIASGSSLAATPAARDWKAAGYAKRQGGRPLPQMVALIPTPVANDDNKTPEAHLAMKERMKGGARRTITSLQVTIKALLPTPKGQNANSPALHGQGGPDLQTVVHGFGTGARLRLQPAMTEWMMGYPKGWLSFPTELVSAKPAGAAKPLRPTATRSSPK